MRLLNIHTKEYGEFHGHSIPSYVITSHRWTANEISFKSFRKRKFDEQSEGYKKIEGFIEFVKRDNQFLKGRDPDWPLSDWIWMDTCCIDQRSNQELSESINSMFAWYSQAHECLAYLADVRPFSAGEKEVMDDFKQSEWFLRGWTLQELLAPSCVIFLNQAWEIIGHKCAYCVHRPTCAGVGPLLNRTISEITGIPQAVLGDYGQSEKSTTQEKMSWMSNRRTTKIEDMAYCLLGIFDINMPLIYGEGPKAVTRLERKIRKEAHRSMMDGMNSIAGYGYPPFGIPTSNQISQSAWTVNPEILVTDSIVTHADEDFLPDDPYNSMVWRAEDFNFEETNDGEREPQSRQLSIPAMPFDNHANEFNPLIAAPGAIAPPSLPLLDRVLDLYKPPFPPTPAKRRVELHSSVNTASRAASSRGNRPGSNSVPSQDDLGPRRKKRPRPRPHPTFECLHEGCAKAGTKFSTQAALRRHSAMKHNGQTNKLFVCEYPGCTVAMPRKDNLMQHMRRSHGTLGTQPRDSSYNK